MQHWIVLPAIHWHLLCENMAIYSCSVGNNKINKSNIKNKSILISLKQIYFSLKLHVSNSLDTCNKTLSHGSKYVSEEMDCNLKKSTLKLILWTLMLVFMMPQYLRFALYYKSFENMGSLKKKTPHLFILTWICAH